jgi:hypothetical protein
MTGEAVRQSIEGSRPRFIVIGGSSADGFGVGDAQRYVSTWARTLNMPLSMHIKHAIRARDAIELLHAASPRNHDVIVLHLAFVDATPVLPPALRRFVKRLKSGRGAMDAVSTDRRLYSRARRKFAHTFERSITIGSAKLGLLVPVQDVQGVRKHYAELEDRLARFEGQLICVLAEHAPGSVGKLRFSTHGYRHSFVELVSGQRASRQLPVAVLDLRDHLDDEHYLDDGFHPNSHGHHVIAEAGLATVIAAGATTQHAER